LGHSFSVALYAVSMVITGFSFMLLRLAIGWRLRHSGSLSSEDKAAEYKHWTSLALYLIAIPLAFSHSYSALGIIALVTLVWIYPTSHVATLSDDSIYPTHDPRQS
jgi:SNF family Na+-dependent transporter